MCVDSRVYARAPDARPPSARERPAHDDDDEFDVDDEFDARDGDDDGGDDSRGDLANGATASANASANATANAHDEGVSEWIKPSPPLATET